MCSVSSLLYLTDRFYRFVHVFLIVLSSYLSYIIHSFLSLLSTSVFHPLHPFPHTCYAPLPFRFLLSPVSPVSPLSLLAFHSFTLLYLPCCRLPLVLPSCSTILLASLSFPSLPSSSLRFSSLLFAFSLSLYFCISLP